MDCSIIHTISRNNPHGLRTLNNPLGLRRERRRRGRMEAKDREKEKRQEKEEQEEERKERRSRKFTYRKRNPAKKISLVREQINICLINQGKAYSNKILE